MTKEEAIDFAALQDQLSAKEAECRQLQKQLHDVRTHAQTLQNKLATAEIILGEVRQPKHSSTDKTDNPS